MQKMNVHQRIRTGRSRLGLTESEFAARVGVSRTAVQHWEREGGTAPSRTHQKAVADLLGMSVSELMRPSDEIAPIAAAPSGLSELGLALAYVYDDFVRSQTPEVRVSVYRAATNAMLSAVRPKPAVEPSEVPSSIPPAEKRHA